MPVPQPNKTTNFRPIALLCVVIIVIVIAVAIEISSHSKGHFTAAGFDQQKIATKTPKKPFVYIANGRQGLATDPKIQTIEALDRNYKNGFRIFKIDFVYTNDNKLVCIHDWKKSAQLVFTKFPDKLIPTYKDYISMPTKDQEHVCTMGSLAAWADLHPDTTFNVEVAPPNLSNDGLKQISQLLPNLLPRMVAHIYTPDQYKPVLAMGYKQVAWDVNKYKIKDHPLIVDGASKMASEHFYGVVGEWWRFEKDHGLPKNLHDKNIAVFISGADKCRLADSLRANVTGLFTDNLRPGSCEK